MKIVADANIPFVKEAFAEFGPVLAIPGKEIVPDVVADATLLLVRSVTRVGPELLEGSKVRFVGTATIGFDHIDTAYLKENAIGFASAPGSNANSVAEYVVAALLELSAKYGFELKDKTLGIIGTGNVGSRVLARAQSLGMNCLLNDPPKKRATHSDAFVELPELLAGADIVTLHVPLTAEGQEPTREMVNEEFLGQMKQGAMLVSTSRGKVVDEGALKKARDKLGGLVMDVWQNEPAIDTEMLDLADIATPHIAGYSFDGKVNGVDMIHESACAFNFHERKWHSGRHLDRSRTSTVDVSSSKNPLLDAVRGAYAIVEDDARMRKLSSTPTDEQGAYFTRLRAEYPKRREFPHYVVACGKKAKGCAEVLQGLGFTVKQ